MKPCSKIWLQRLVVGFCIILGSVSWQVSAADEVYLDHKHCASHDGEHDHKHDHGDDDHAGGHHHCPNCSAHFVGLTSAVFLASAGYPDTYQRFITDRSLLRSEAPPTPPPNL